MPEIFISYSAKDSALARQLHGILTIAGVDAFLAEISLQPGTQWKDQVLENLRQSKWFLFLATPNSCSSDAVKHEIGAALSLNKNLVPLMYGIQASQLPEWVKDKQAVNLSNAEQRERFLSELGASIRQDRTVGAAIVLGLLLAGLYIFSRY